MSDVPRNDFAPSPPSRRTTRRTAADFLQFFRTFFQKGIDFWAQLWYDVRVAAQSDRTAATDMEKSPSLVEGARLEIV